jgi:hypothetical protein
MMHHVTYTYAVVESDHWSSCLTMEPPSFCCLFKGPIFPVDVRFHSCHYSSINLEMTGWPVPHNFMTWQDGANILFMGKNRQ